jgi:hypothetical protein
MLERAVEREDLRCRSFAGWGSLSPERERAHLPSELLARVPSRERDALAPILAEIGDALRTSFPANLFCDLDATTQHLLMRPLSERAPLGRRLARLHQTFGAEPIRFRYVHDFLYGFDWARWVARDPEGRASVGPYDAGFLDYLEQRGGELIELIGRDDHKYPQLRTPEHRNPFPFSREPDAETRLHRSLAQKGLIPVAAWSFDARAVWDRPFARLREQEALALGLDVPQTKSSSR